MNPELSNGKKEIGILDFLHLTGIFKEEHLRRPVIRSFHHFAHGSRNRQTIMEGKTMQDINRILVVSGVTKYCRQGVHYGVSLAHKYEAELYIIHVVHNPFGYEGFNLPMVSLDDAYKNIIKETEDDLDSMIAKEKAKGLNIRKLIKEGEPTKEIMKVIKEKHIDLLILLAQEESRLERMEARLEKLIFGRSNEELIRKMPCQILLVKQEFKTE
jgi:universal stress protein A